MIGETDRPGWSVRRTARRRAERCNADFINVKQWKNCQERQHCGDTSAATFFVWQKFVLSSGVVPATMTVR
jgi:hypothetical protein